MLVCVLSSETALFIELAILIAMLGMSIKMSGGKIERILLPMMVMAMGLLVLHPVLLRMLQGACA